MNVASELRCRKPQLITKMARPEKSTIVRDIEGVDFLCLVRRRLPPSHVCSGCPKVDSGSSFVSYHPFFVEQQSALNWQANLRCLLLPN